MTSAQRCAVTIILVFVSTPALAQALVVPPNQLAIGMGVAADGQPVRAPARVFPLRTPTAATRFGPPGSASSSRAR